MAIGHIAIRPHSRGRGHSAAAALAYRHAEKLVDCRTGAVYDFTHRRVRDGELVDGGLVAHPAWTHGTTKTERLQALADRIERAEKRKNSRILRDIQPALPCELTEKQQVRLTRTFAERLSERYGTTVAWAVHRPKAPEPPDALGRALDEAGSPLLDAADSEGENGAATDHHDKRNTHAHIVLPTRSVAWSGEFSNKIRQLDDRRGPQEVVEIRALWEITANEALAKAGSEARVHTGLRLDAEPEPTAGPGATRAERKTARKRVADHRKDSAGQTRRYAPALTEALSLGLDALAEAERSLKRRIAATRQKLAAIYQAIAEALQAPQPQLAAALAGAASTSTPATAPTPSEARGPPQRKRRRRNRPGASRKEAAAYERGRADVRRQVGEFLDTWGPLQRADFLDAWDAWEDPNPAPDRIEALAAGPKAARAAGFADQQAQFNRFLRTLSADREQEFRVRFREWRATRSAAAHPGPEPEPESGPTPH